MEFKKKEKEIKEYEINEKVKLKCKSEEKNYIKLKKKANIIDVKNSIISENNPIKLHLNTTVQMAFFRKYYWKSRQIIFQELFDLLGDSLEPIDLFRDKKGNKESKKELEEKNNPKDDYSDIKDFKEEDFSIFFENDNNEKRLDNIKDNRKEKESEENIDEEGDNKKNESIENRKEKESEKNIDEEVDNKKNESMEEDNYEEEESMEEDNYEEKESLEEKNFEEEENESSIIGNFTDKDDFLKNSKKNIFNKYQTNYIEKKYEFKNKDFSLGLDEQKNVYFQIKKRNIFKIDYLLQINLIDKKEWVCNSYYGLYLIYIIEKFTKAYPKLDENSNSKIKEKTIENFNDFDMAISYGITNFKDFNYELDFDLFLKDAKYHSSNDLIEKSQFKEFLNLEYSKNNKGGKEFQSLFYTIFRKPFPTLLTYIFANEYDLNNKTIINSLNNCYFSSNDRFLYLDINYIDNIKTNNDLKAYFSYWIIKVFLKQNYKSYKEICKNIMKIISLNNIEKLIEYVIRYNDTIYGSSQNKLFIVLNNVDEKYHNIINNIKKNMEFNYNFYIIAICNINRDYNLNLFFQLYGDNTSNLYIIEDSQNPKEVKYKNKDINKLFNENKDLNSFCDLVKLFNFNYYMRYNFDKLKIIKEDIFFLKRYFKFINLICENNNGEINIINLKFKNKSIENKFLAHYQNCATHFINSEKHLKMILGNTDGCFFEAALILDILTERIGHNIIKDLLDFEKMKVKSIFGFQFNKDFKSDKYKEKNLLITQESLVGEIFDFAILINENNNILMKLIQVSTNKSKEDLERLDSAIIKLHCINIQNEFKKKGIYINNFSFLIITSKIAYNKYLDNKNLNSGYKLMDEFCKRQNYELIIYDIVERKLQIEKGNKLEDYQNLYKFENKTSLVLPDYNNFFKLEPKFMSTKNVNQKYCEHLGQYLAQNNSNNYPKIIGKIKYNTKLIDENIEDEGIGLLISGVIKSKIEIKNKQIIYKKNKDRIKSEIKIFKEKNKTYIYEKNKEKKQIDEIQKLPKYFSKAHAILIKLNKNTNLLGKKRYPEYLFIEELLKKRNNKFIQ